MNNTENIKLFLQTEYSDERLAMLLAHAEEGKLSFMSCCCLRHIPTAQHALRGAEEFHTKSHGPKDWDSVLGYEAEIEFLQLGETDAKRRERLIPLILEEMRRREESRNQFQGTTILELEAAVVRAKRGAR